MCGACGTSGAGHWSAPFLASQPARSAAARAVTAMTGRRVTVAGTSAGYLVSTPTGNRKAVADLGRVWDVVAPPGSPCRTDAAPVTLPGPATLPELRAALTRVVLVVSRTGEPQSKGTPGRRRRKRRPDRRPTVVPTELSGRLREHADRQRSQTIRMLVEKTYVDRHLAELRAHPTRPFAITDVHHDDPTTPSRSKPAARSSSSRQCWPGWPQGMADRPAPTCGSNCRCPTVRPSPST